jgi:hypothetical protein
LLAGIEGFWVEKFVHNQNIQEPPMNSPEQTNPMLPIGEEITLDPVSTATQQKPHPTWSRWIRRFFACNPFYLASATLLLYGVYRVSVDPSVFQREVLQLVFNFSSLQIYALVLTITAVLLARRSIWYDSNLLVGLEHLLVFVPFILVSQAALIDSRMVWTMCLSGAVLVAGRHAVLKRGIRCLNLPASMAVMGTLLLILNTALPLLYRHFHESKFGTKPDWGTAYYFNQYAWLLVLPAVCALLNLVPFEAGKREPLPSRGWLPVGWYVLWLAGTTAHLYSLGYVYDFDLRHEWTAPAVWALSWTLWRRADLLAPLTKPIPGLNGAELNRALLLLPLLVAPLGITQARGSGVFFALAALNTAAYGILAIRGRHGLLPLHLLLISLVCAIAVSPVGLAPEPIMHFSRGKVSAFSAAIYLLVWALLSRNPRLGIAGGIVAALLTTGVPGLGLETVRWALHIGLVFLLIHSLRWKDSETAGAAMARTLSAVAWGLHAVWWQGFGGGGAAVSGPAVVLLAIYVIARLTTGRWSSLDLPVAAAAVILAGPAKLLAQVAFQAPIGMLAIAASFLLFAAGTAAALTRHLWHRQ